MRWPWSKRETRDSGGDFEQAVLRAIEAQAAGTAADTGSTAAVEAAAGALSRAFCSATVDGAPHVRQAVSPAFLGRVGRDLVRSGASMHVIDMDRAGRVSLLPCSSWHFEGNAHPETWTVRATYFGPSTSTTKHLSFSGVVWIPWGVTPGQPYVGTGPLKWASLTARLQSETERSLADEAKGPLANIIPIPSDGGGDELAKLKTDIKAARGKAAFVETTAAGWGEGMSGAPRKDWVVNRLGPNPPATLEAIRKGSFDSVLAASGTPPSLFTDADGTSQREALRRWHQGTVLPLAKVVQDEIEAKLEGECRLTFDSYALDMVSRASVVDKLVRAGVPTATALAAVGLDD